MYQECLVFGVIESDLGTCFIQSITDKISTLLPAMEKKKNILLATPNFRWLVAIQCYSTPTKYPINSAIIHKEKFIHLVNGDIQNIDTIITCWTWVTWIWPFRSIPGCTVTCGSIGVGCCIIGSTMLCSRVLDDRVSRIDYSGNCCIEPNHWTMLCFKKWNVFVQKCK